jgi:uncharacterized membrane protein YtjA (UPF0391 family)
VKRMRISFSERYSIHSKPLGPPWYGERRNTDLQRVGIAARFQKTRTNQNAGFRAWVILKVKHEEAVMLRWALGFFILALVAAVLGFTGIAVAAAGIAKIIFFIFLVLFLVSLVGHLLRRV